MEWGGYVASVAGLILLAVAVAASARRLLRLIDEAFEAVSAEIFGPRQ